MADAATKLETGKSKKAEGDEAFKSGNVVAGM